MSFRVPPALVHWWRTFTRRQRAELLDEARLTELGFEVPHTHHHVHEAIAALIVRAPDYRLRNEPEYDIEVAYSVALQGLDRLHGITPSTERAAHIDRCRATLVDAYMAFKSGDARRGLALARKAEQDFVALGPRAKGR
jgi:hypothetical protein